jgi:hypothetical protein
MPKVKIIEVHPSYYDLDEDSQYKIANDITSWEEVTQEELEMLQDGMWNAGRMQGKKYVLLVQHEVSVPPVLQPIRKFLAELEKEKQQRINARKKDEAKREEAKKRRELKALERLEEKYRKSPNNES